MVSVDKDGAGRRGNLPPEFIFMLTRNDMTVPDALAVYGQVRDIPGLRYVGFKDVGTVAATGRGDP